MASRFPRTLHFPDYTTAELLDIADAVVDGSAYRLTDGARRAIRDLCAEAPRDRGFGNGRFVRNLVEATIDRQASRIARAVRAGRSPDPDALSQLRADDVPTGDDVAALGGRRPGAAHDVASP
jgi:hypothetical protein